MSRIARLLNAQAEVWRPAKTPDGMGGWSEGWAQVATVRARFSQPNSMERVRADQSQDRLTHVVHLDPSADVRRGDQLRNGGRQFRVMATYEPSVPGTYLRADCEYLQPIP